MTKKFDAADDDGIFFDPLFNSI